MNRQKIKIIIADNQELFRKSLVTLLQTNSQFEVCTDVSNGRELLEFLKQTEVDIVLLDTEIPVMDGKTTLEIIHRRFPETRVIILSRQSNMQLQSDFMAYGANGFLSKNCDVKTLFKAIQGVNSEGYFFDSSTSKALLDTVLKDKQRASVPSVVKLSDRETEILKGICDGKTNKQMAAGLNLSASTIDFYRTKIYGKTKCNNVTSLLKYALKNGLAVLS